MMMTTPNEADAAFRNQRRALIASSSNEQIGIDYVVVADSGADGAGQRWRLTLHFIPKTAEQNNEGSASTPSDNEAKTDIFESLPTQDQFRITGLTPLVNANLQVTNVDKGPSDHTLALTLSYRSEAAQVNNDLPTFVLWLDNVPNLDPFFNHVNFSLTIDSDNPIDPTEGPPEAVVRQPAPTIDYLAKDFQSFRQLMLNRLSVLMPDWQAHGPADMGQALVEVLAYAADQVSYYQDAVATEAYLGTARQRVSVRRHARLLDYTISEGCNARVWVQVQCRLEETKLPLQTPLMAGGVGPTVLQPYMAEYEQSLMHGAQIFESMHEQTLYQSHNEVQIYTWGAPNFYLPVGTSQMTLITKLITDIDKDGSVHYKEDSNGLRLREGDVLIIEQVKDMTTGQTFDSPTMNDCFHAVRLTKVESAMKDPLSASDIKQATAIVTVSWDHADALPVPFIVSQQRGQQLVEDISVVRGNIVLADHGFRVQENLNPRFVPTDETYRPHLMHTDLTFQTPYDHASAQEQPAATMLTQDPQTALPAIKLYEESQPSRPPWVAQRDLLTSQRNSAAFVVEMTNERQAELRFGDGIFGKRPQPETEFRAHYRVGNGPAGNLGRETIGQLVDINSRLGDAIQAVRNIGPAQGGLAPESLDHVRRNAPYAFQTQERCVTEADYEAILARHSEVKQGKATRRWTGSWHTMFLAVQRVNNRPVDADFRKRISAFMQPHLLADADIEIRGPSFVALEIQIGFRVHPGHFISTVKQALLETFSNRNLPDGTRGFFHPDNFGFGQPVYASTLVAHALAVPGVADATLEKFGRWGEDDTTILKQGYLPIGPLEIARLDNNPDAPEYGRFRL